MGYHMQQIGSVFTLKRTNEKGALAAIKALAGRETITDSSGKHFSWVCDDFATKYDNLHDMMEEWRWELEYDDDGNVDAIQFTGEKIGDDLLLFQAIAPFVEAGSYIEMRGEDGSKWKWTFDGMTCKEMLATDTYEDDSTVSEQEQRRFTTLMNEFLGNASEITVNTSADAIKQAVKAAGGEHAYILQLWTDFIVTKQ